MNQSTCFYYTTEHTGLTHEVHCAGKLCFIVHDKRGCMLVCQAHARWSMKTLRCSGHSDDCPYRYETHWKQVTVV